MNDSNKVTEQQVHINSLIDAQNWKEIASIMVSDDLMNVFKNEIVNVAVLLPPDFNKYLRSELRAAHQKQFENEQIGHQETINNLETQYRAKLNEFELKQTELLNANEQKIQEINTANDERLDKIDNDLKSIKALQSQKISELKETHKSYGSDFAQHPVNTYNKKLKEFNDSKSRLSQSEIELRVKSLNEMRIAVEPLAQLNKEYRNKKQELESVKQEISELRNKRLAEMDVKNIEDITKLNADYKVDLQSLDDDIEKLKSSKSESLKEFESNLDANVKNDVDRVNSFISDPDILLQSLNYLAANGKMDKALEYILPNGNPEVILNFLTEQTKLGRLNDIVDIISNKDQNIKDSFVMPLITAVELHNSEIDSGNHIKDAQLHTNIYKLNVSLNTALRLSKSYLESQNYKTSYLFNNIAKRSDEGFAIILSPLINDYNQLMNAYSQLGDNTKVFGAMLGASLVSAGKSADLKTSDQFLQMIHARVVKDEALTIDEKVNLASILSDALTFVKESKLDDDQKFKIQNELETIYLQKIKQPGTNELATILNEYIDKGFYRALKIATYNILQSDSKSKPSEKLVAEAAEDKLSNNFAETILYAPSLESFGKTKAAINKVVGKELNELSLSDKIKSFFAPILSLFKLMPDPKDLLHAAGYIVGLRANKPEVDKQSKDNLDAAKNEIRKGASLDVEAKPVRTL